MREDDASVFFLKPVSRAPASMKMIGEADELISEGDSISLPEAIELRRKERIKLLELYGQSVDRFNEIEHALYLKHQFISKTLPDEKERRCKILNMLLADRGILFTYGNDGYWNRQINRQIISEHRRLFRDKTLQEKLCEDIPAWQSMASVEKEIHIALLVKITRLAAKKHQNLDNWVKGNIVRETPSAEERMSIVRLPTVGQTEKENDIFSNLQFLITDIIPDSLCRQVLPQSQAYLLAEQNVESFRKILPEHSDKIDSSFCRTFVNDILPDYMQKITQATTLEYRSDHVPESQEAEIAYEFSCYKSRLCKLEAAQKDFQQSISPILNLTGLRYFEMEPIDGGKSSEVSTIESSILSFFSRLGCPLIETDKNYLSQRINWAKNVQPVPRALIPAFILYMVLCCGRRLPLGSEVEIPKQTNGPYFLERLSRPKQRFEQLLLLDELCNIFCANGDDRYHNWNQFLIWQGKNIASEDEYNFWNFQKKNFEFIPEAIMFQLLCREYLSECFPIYIENLAYTSCSKLHLGAFLRFWKENHPEICKQAFDFEQQHPRPIKEYFKLWKGKKAESYFFEGTPWLNNLLEKPGISLQNFQVPPDVDLQELKRLILETEFRICISRRAQEKLARLLCAVYELDFGLFNAIF